ncbi:signal peptidase I [Kocuria sp. ZOR0020]|uniref:signal peptidase I n=1 Tax=Kocuria sp. ZOR0020 TaxID=1339234 RepID=UPI00068A597E|nr:signal peptidase I [Kocuria sp. ZOR0020]
MTPWNADSRTAAGSGESQGTGSSTSETWVAERWEDLGEAPATREDGVPMYRRRSGRRARDANPPTRPRGRVVTVLRELAVVVVWALLIAFVAKHVLVRGFLIPSDAMAPTLVSGDRVFVNVLDTTLRPAERGDVIVFKDSQGWLPPADEPETVLDWIRDGMAFLGVTVDDSDNHVVKRVIGVGGDRVRCCDSQGRLVINDVPVDETTAYLPAGDVALDTPFDVIVPDNHYFVLGDRRTASEDSRFYLPENRAFVSQNDVVGTAFVVTWPLGRTGAVTDWSEVFDRVPDPPASHRMNRWQ